MRLPAPPPMSRYQLLAELHRVLRPETYLEVGVQTGASLALAEGAGVAIGIDPYLAIQDQFRRDNQRLQGETADAYFSCQSCERPVIDFAFIDGSHLFEDALRDFIHIQRHAGPHTVVVFDDVSPYSQDIAWRHQPPGDWTGDVFKIPYILRQYQPGLEQIMVDVTPTGALIVTGLDPKQVTLDRQYDRVVREYLDGHYELAVPDETTGDKARHWNYVPRDVLDRVTSVSGQRALDMITAKVADGELAKGKVRA